MLEKILDIYYAKKLGQAIIDRFSISLEVLTSRKEQTIEEIRERIDKTF